MIIMRRTFVALVLFLVIEAFVPGAGAAAGNPARTFALIVTNNRSIQPGRPDLRHADDDGARYYELFRMVAPAEDVFLFTELDGDTERLFPSVGAVARLPTRQTIEAAAIKIGRDVEAAMRAGQTAEFYFIYAGHGDVDQGRGFIQLADGPLYSEGLEVLLAKIPATHSHVVLDSCNSFFMINARKPGGRRFATPEDAARSLSKRLPNVGVFLSTSAEAEVFEWSELHSGIFSHAVRSGLAGAADANGDGVVSYEELQAFVDTSTAGVRNPAYRPKVYARGPGGKGAEPLFSPAQAAAPHFAELRIDAARRLRLTIRDADELPWVDVFKEEGAALSLRLPMPRLKDATVEELDVTDAGARVVRRYRFQATADAPAVNLGTLALAEATREPRGPGELLKMMFARPFGPRALALYQKTSAAEPPPVFGISRDDTERMSLLLTHIGEMEHRSRLTGTAVLVAFGIPLLATGISLAGETFTSASNEKATYKALGYTLAGVGAGSIVAGGVGLIRRSPAEKLRQEFDRGMHQGGDPALVVAKTEKELDELASDYRKTRILLRWLGFGFAGLGVYGLVQGELHDRGDGRSINRFSYGLLGLWGAWVAFSSFYEYPIEQMARLWQSDPGIRQLPRLSVSPLAGGASIGVRGTF